MIWSFWLSFSATLALLAIAAITGRQGRRRAHYVAASLAVAMLAVTVVLTERLAGALVFPETEMRIHLFIAQSTVALALAVVATGITTIKRPAARRYHRVAVASFLIAAVAATSTGVWVFSLSTPR